MQARPWGVAMFSMLAASASFAACGSGDEKRTAAADAGQAGEEHGVGGSHGGVPGDAGSGGAEVAGPAGAGGAGAEGSSGAAGAAGADPGYADEPVPGDTFASPSGTDVDNDCRVEATPCQTVTFAASQAAPQHTVWLASAAYTSADQPDAASVVDGIRVRARVLGEAVLQVRLTLLGSHRVEGLTIDGGPSNIGNPGIDITTGTVALEGVTFGGRLGTALSVAGDAVVTMSPGGVADYVTDISEYVDGAGYDPFAQVAGSAQLEVSGGTFGGPGLGHGSALPRMAYGAAFSVLGDAKLVLDGVTLEVRTRGIGLRQNASLRLKDSKLTAVAMTTAGYGVWVTNDGGAANIEIEGSTIDGFAYANASAAVAVLEDPPEQTEASITISNSTLSNSSFGVMVSTPSSADLGFSDVDIVSNFFGGIFCPGTCSLQMNGGTLTGNGSYSATTGWGYYGGMYFGAADKAYDIRLRDVAVHHNRNVVNDGNTNSDTNSGLTLVGNATSSFDLGTSADPGGNTFFGHDTGAATTNLNVKVNGTVLVSAVGNTFDANIQGASATGTYALGTAPCSANSCDLGAGAGANYRVTSGTLRLAE